MYNSCAYILRREYNEWLDSDSNILGNPIAMLITTSSFVTGLNIYKFKIIT